MRHFSLKLKLTLLHTLLMTLLVCGVLAVLFSVSNQEILSNVQGELTGRVEESFEEIRFREGRLVFDRDLLETEDGVYLSVYDTGGNFLYGKTPYGFENPPYLQDGNLRKYTAQSVRYYVFDLAGTVDGYGELLVRGIASITSAEESVWMMLRLSLLLLPLFVVLTGILTWFMTRHTLKPVSRITKTVQEIRREADLSRRIALGAGKDEIYELAATFDQLLEQVETVLSRERQFTSDVSHELRTPVAVVMMQCEALLEEELPSESRREVETIYRKVRYLSQMISQLLLLSRADQGREKLVMEQLDLSALTEMAADEARERAAVRGITVEAQVEQGIFFCGDETLLIRLWMNLLNNAIAYGREKGHIRVRLFRENGAIAGWVEDDGIGISQEDLPKIWGRFYQADPSRTDGESAGLGLSMVRWIVQAHGGAVHAESVQGKGSRFIFTFPG